MFKTIWTNYRGAYSITHWWVSTYTFNNSYIKWRDDDYKEEDEIPSLTNESKRLQNNGPIRWEQWTNQMFIPILLNVTLFITNHNLLKLERDVLKKITFFNLKNIFKECFVNVKILNCYKQNNFFIKLL